MKNKQFNSIVKMFSSSNAVYTAITTYFIYVQSYQYWWTDNIKYYIVLARKVPLVLTVLLTIFCIVVRIFEKYKTESITKKLIYCFTFLFIFILLFTYARPKKVLFCLILGCLAFHLDFRKILKLNLIVKLTGLAIDLLGLLFHYTYDVVGFRNGLSVHALGFMHHNWLGLEVMGLMFIVWYLYLQKKPKFSLVVLSLVSILLYLISNSQTALVCQVCFLLVFILYSFFSLNEKRKKRLELLINNKVFQTVVIATPFILCLISLTCCYYVDIIFGPLRKYSFLNSFIERFLIGKLYLEKIGITLLGLDLDTIAADVGAYTGFDNMYVRMLIESGVIFTTVVFFWISATIRKCFKEKNYGLLTIEVVFLLHGIMERFDCEFMINFPLFSLFTFTYFSTLRFIDNSSNSNSLGNNSSNRIIP